MIRRCSVTARGARSILRGGLLSLLVLILRACSALAQPVLTVNGLNANYTTAKVFVDELTGDSFPVTISFQPNAANLTSVEIFTNLNRRDRAELDANGDGIEDGILPPSGDLVLAGNDNYYFKAYAMTHLGGGQFHLVLNAQKAGAYRLTARYKVLGNTNWIYYNDFGGNRDHAIVVSPAKSREMVLYELNTLNVEGTGPSFAQRSTFEDLLSAAQGDTDGFDPFNLDYVKNLGANWLWFQPIHPPGIDGRQIDPDTGQPFEVGSPYAVKNFFKVMPLMGSDNTFADALLEFQNFVNQADLAQVHVMLDAPFNHTSHDCELADAGVSYFSPGSAPTDEIRNREVRFYSRSGEYCQRAFSAASIAVAPDRGDFGKFADTFDSFFGRYAALVCQNPADNGNHLNEGDWFDYAVATGNFDGITHNVWKYFVDYILFWLDQTGCPAGTSTADQLFKGIDGLRADFAQGLPPQAWEYIINKTRTRKWAFVFMAESLDGGPVAYRSNRHFDVLNENIVFALSSASTATDYRNIFESRRDIYGLGLVLLNSTSHDEANYADPWEALIRFAVNGSVDGVPMVFYGQELGISSGTFGFNRYELNSGKMIPHFKKYNSLKPAWDDANFGNDQLYPVYAGIAQARQSSRALRSSNRYFLNQTGSGSPQPKIFSVAKYETANGAPNFHDVVFAFANLDRHNDQQGNFDLNITQNGSNLFGIKASRFYNVKNIAAYTAQNPNRRHLFLFSGVGPGGGILGSDLLNSGLFVTMTKVPTTNDIWSTSPYEAQYVKLYDVTPPPTPGAPGTAKPYALTNSVNFFWAAVNDPEGGVASYRLVVGSSAGGSEVFQGNVGLVTNFLVSGSFGQTLYAYLEVLNNAGIPSVSGPVSNGVRLLTANGDEDNDGMSNSDEDFAATNPLDANSVLRIISLANGGTLLTWSSVPDKTYRVFATTNLALAFAALSAVIPSTGTTTSYTNGPASGPHRFYRVGVLP